MTNRMHQRRPTQLLQQRPIMRHALHETMIARTRPSLGPHLPQLGQIADPMTQRQVVPATIGVVPAGLAQPVPFPLPTLRVADGEVLDVLAVQRTLEGRLHAAVAVDLVPAAEVEGPEPGFGRSTLFQLRAVIGVVEDGLSRTHGEGHVVAQCGVCGGVAWTPVRGVGGCAGFE